MYSMAAVNFTTYHQEFFPKFLTSVGEGLSEAQQAELAKNYKMVEVRNVLLLRGGNRGWIQGFQQVGGGGEGEMVHCDGKGFGGPISNALLLGSGLCVQSGKWVVCK